MVGSKVILISNMEPHVFTSKKKKFRKINSQGMILYTRNEEKNRFELLVPHEDSVMGERVRI